MTIFAITLLVPLHSDYGSLAEGVLAGPDRG
jgi:hypothetical protein